MRRWWLLPLLVLLTLGATGSSKTVKMWGNKGVQVAGVKLEHRRVVELEAPLDKRLVVESAVGDIELQGVSGGMARLSVEVYEYKPNDLSVSLVESGYIVLTSAGGHPGALGEVKGEIPAHISLRLGTGTGDIFLRDLDGGDKVEVESGYGDITLQDFQDLESLEAATGKGEIRLGPAEDLAHVDLATGMGGIKLKQAQVGELKVATGLGSINVLRCELGMVTGATGMGDITFENSRYDDADLGTGLGQVKRDKE